MQTSRISGIQNIQDINHLNDMNLNGMDEKRCNHMIHVFSVDALRQQGKLELRLCLCKHALTQFNIFGSG